MRGRDDLLEHGSPSSSRDWDAAPRVGFEDTHLTVRAHAKLAGHSATPPSWCRPAGWSKRLRAVKDDERDRGDPRARPQLADERVPVADLRLRPGRAHRARGRASRSSVAGEGARRRRAVVPADRRALPQRRAAARRAARRARSRATRSSSSTSAACSTPTARTARGRSRPARSSARPARSTSWCAPHRRRRSRRCAPGADVREVDARRARLDRGGGPRRAVRSRARARRRPRGPRGAAAGAHGGAASSRRATS